MDKSEFLSRDEVAELTGWKQAKKQTEHLRSLGLLFFQNAKGYPIVARSVVNGERRQKKEYEPIQATWQPNIVN